MKKLMILSIFIATFFFSCKTQEKSTGYTYDDVYTNRSAAAKTTTKPKIQNNDLSASRPIVSADSSSKQPAVAATSPIDYSDNSYAARIKRFNDKNPGLDYSSEYYTKSSDSTSSSGGGNPNVSLYFGDSWGYPFLGTYYSLGWGFGWGDFGFGWDYPYFWGYPYYYYPYSMYWGYPYWGWGGYGHHHYRDWYNGNYFYGQRTVSSPNGGRNARTTASTNNTIQTKNSRIANSGTVNHSVDQTRSGRTDINRVSPDKQHYTYVRSNTQENTRIRNTQDNRYNSSRPYYAQRQEPAPRYARPGTHQQMSRSNAQAYSSPAYRQPKSSQEYINPHTQQGRPTGVSENPNRNGNYSNPASTGRRYSSPSNYGGNSRVYSNPYGSSRFYNTPSRSYSSPGHFGSSRSFGSGYSAPSHSGGGGGSSHGGGGGGGGSHGGGGGRR